MELKNPLAGIQKSVSHQIYRYKHLAGVRENVHTGIFLTATTLTLGSVTIAAEAMDIHLSSEPDTVQNSLLRASCRAVAIGAGYLTAKTVGEVFAEPD